MIVSVGDGDGASITIGGQEGRNPEKKRCRLKKKTKLLSDKDLLDVLHLRTVEKADKQTAAAAEDKDASADAAPAASVKKQKV